MREGTFVLWIRSAPDRESIDLAERLDQFVIHMTQSADDALERLRAGRSDVILAEFPIPGWSTAQLLESVQEIDPRIPVLIRDPAATISDAVRLVKLGAYHVLSSALDPYDLEEHLERAGEQRRLRESASGISAAKLDAWKNTFVGESRVTSNVEEIIGLAGPTRSTVLITGETGTGKEVVARGVHQASPRAHLPMVAVNCSALPENLLEAELFGHVKGAFTGALQHRIGRFEQAHASTLFLDEIGEMPLELQAKLLRVLQEREFQRIGSSETVRVDVRIIAASNVDLNERVNEGLFREDLFYRLNVVPIEMPPLRERASDIPLLVHHFLEKICQAEGISLKRISREAIDRLCTYDWPGNIRQLQNKVERAVVLSGSRRDLYPADFPLPAADVRRPRIAPLAPAMTDDGIDFEMATANFERSILQQAIEKSGGNKTVAANLLRMKRTTLLAKLRNLEINSQVNFHRDCTDEQNRCATPTSRDPQPSHAL